MSLEGLDHVAITVADVDATLDWYERVLGAEAIHRELWADGTIPIGLLQVGGSRLSVHPAAAPAAPHAVTPTPGDTLDGDACSLVDAFRPASARRWRSSRPPWRPSRPAISTASPTSTPSTRSAARVGRRVAAVRRRAHGHQGARAGRGLAGHRGLAGVPRPHRHAHVAPASQRLLERRRRGAGGPDHGQRVRRAQRERHQAQRRHPQPVAARPHRRRIVGRLGRGGGRRPGQPGHRWRRGRLDPHPGRLHAACSA